MLHLTRRFSVEHVYACPFGLFYELRMIAVHNTRYKVKCDETLS
jgi:hypothetical protein